MRQVAHDVVEDLADCASDSEYSPSHGAWKLVLKINLEDAIEETHKVVALEQICTVYDTAAQVTNVNLKSVSRLGYAC